MDCTNLQQCIGAFAADPAWWTAVFTAVLGFMAVLAFVAAKRAANAAVRGANAAVSAFKTQQAQLDEMRHQTQKMGEKIADADSELYKISLWIESKEIDDARIMYTNSSAHPYYNVHIELSGMSDNYYVIPVLEPTTAPVELIDASKHFKRELANISFVGDGFPRPGVAFQFDTPTGHRYIRDNSGSIASAGGGPHSDPVAHKWRPY